MEFPAISTAISFVKDISSTIVAAATLPTKKENVDLTDKISSLLTQLISIKDYVSKLELEKRDLEDRMKQYTHWFEQVVPNYKLIALAEGVFVYSNSESMEKEGKVDYSAHYLCPRCFHHKRESPLQNSGYSNNGLIYKCLECGIELCNHNDRPPTYDPTVPNTRRNKWGV